MISKPFTVCTRWAGAVAGLCALLLGAGAAAAAVDGGRDFDARIELNRGLSFGPSAGQDAALTEFRGGVPGLAADVDGSTGATRSLRNPGGYLTRAFPGADPSTVAAGFVNANLDLLGLGRSDFADHEITDTVPSRVSGATHVYYRQTFGGVPVYNGQLQVSVNRDGRILSVANSFMPDLGRSVNVLRPRLSAEDAVGSAFAHLNAVGSASRPSLAWLPINRGVARLVWNFQVATDDLQHHYDFTVDAVSGRVWTRFDWVSDTQEEYTVYAEPIESPIHTSPLPPSDARTLEVAPANATASPLGWHDTGSTAYTIARGNNVHAYPDRDGNNAPDFDVDCNDGAGSPHCNFAIDLTVNPPAYIDAAVANLFYWNNYIHDTQYLYGFDEASGNFQVNNFGNGGLGNDDVRAEAQDNDLGGSNCNANFFTPADGSRPRMQMFTCANASPERDGDFDNLVIVHEYTHGISNRLVGGPSNANCLNNTQQPGEGWSDLFGLIYTHQAGFSGTDARGVGSYLFDLAAVGGTIRTFPYSTSFGVNPDTYSDIQFRSVPHGVGSVYAELAWEAYWELVNYHNGASGGAAFDPDLQNVNFATPSTVSGNQRALLYFNEGMKTTPCSPTFIDVRDSVLTAAVDTGFGVEDYCPLYQGYARRGLGTNASTAGPFSLSATDGFDLPAQCDENPSCGDGVCEFSESCDGSTPGTTACGADCNIGGGGAVCGNDVCEAGNGENCITCPDDCNGKVNGKPANRFCCGFNSGESTPYDPDGCGAGSQCNSGGNTCTEIPVTGGGDCCGDYLCQGAENETNCALDCVGGGGEPPCTDQGGACSATSECCPGLKCKGGQGGKTCKP